MNSHWVCLALGSTVVIPTVRRPSVWQRLQSLVAYVRAHVTYRHRGFGATSRYLAHLERRCRPIQTVSGEQAVLLARSEMVLMRLVGRAIGEDTSACLEASASLAAGLMQLGLPAELVVGKMLLFANPTYDFHAWVEVDGIPVNERGNVRNGCLPLFVCPTWRHKEQASEQPNTGCPRGVRLT
jgi:hypothetical protein